MKNKKTFLVLILFVLLMAGAGLLYNKLGSQYDPDQLTVQEKPGAVETENQEDLDEEVPEKILAPDFTIYDEDGNSVQLHDYFGKPIVLNFWASWCGPCKMEMPDFQEKYLELGDEIHFLMVNMTGGRETLDSATAFIDEQTYTFPVFYDLDADAAMTYGVYSLPTTYFIDSQGCAIARATGAIDAATLQQGIDMIWPAE